MKNLVKITLLGALIAVLNSSFAFAYAGPGAGLSAIGSLLSLLAAIGLAIVGFVWYPIKRLLRYMRPKQNQPGE